MEASLKMLMALNASNVTARLDAATIGRTSTNAEAGSADEDRSRESIAKLENELKRTEGIILCLNRRT